MDVTLQIISTPLMQTVEYFGVGLFWVKAIAPTIKITNIW